jgi:integrase/recombinase XerD
MNALTTTSRNGDALSSRQHLNDQQPAEMAQKGQNTPSPEGGGLDSGVEMTESPRLGVAHSETAPSTTRPTAANVLAPGRLDRLARGIANQLRRRARAFAGIRGRTRKASRLPDTLTPTELREILAEAYRGRPRDGLVIRLLFESALRVAELSYLEAGDVDLAERTVRVREGKGGKDRVALIGEDLAQLLRVHLDERTRGPLFTSSRGTRLSVRRIQSVVRDAARRAGIGNKRISPHTFRHTWATLARNAGLPLDTVQRLLGHANPRTTEVYARLALSRAREEYDVAMRTIERPHAHHAESPTAAGGPTHSPL